MKGEQQAFKDAYLNEDSPTYLDAKASGLAVGMSEERASIIMSPAFGPKWALELVEDYGRLKKSEQVLDAVLQFEMVDAASINAVGKVAMFVAETLGKHKYSKRTEMTGKDGNNLIPTPILADLQVIKQTS